MSEIDQPEETSYGLVLSFTGLYESIEEEHAFVHGFEAGKIWTRMKSGLEAEIEATTHAVNRVVIERAAIADGWVCEIKPTGTEGWDYINLRKVSAAKINPHGLRVVPNDTR